MELPKKTVPVRDPLMILATVPRVIGINETIELPVLCFCTETRTIKDVSLSVSSNSLLTINGSDKLSVSFSAIGEKGCPV